MASGVAFLRGVNLAGHKIVKMAELKAACESLGLEDVRTYLQSGNVVFRGKAKAEEIARAVRERTGVDARVVLRTAAELRKVIEGNPFPGRDGSRLLVAFLDAPLKDETRVRPITIEEVRIAGRHVYIYYPEGQGKSRLRVLDDSATMRNWNTVTAMMAMCG
jgi:uncharacterized protein (DUF1697 family)